MQNKGPVGFSQISVSRDWRQISGWTFLTVWTARSTFMSCVCGVTDHQLFESLVQTQTSLKCRSAWRQSEVLQVTIQFNLNITWQYEQRVEVDVYCVGLPGLFPVWTRRPSSRRRQVQSLLLESFTFAKSRSLDNKLTRWSSGRDQSGFMRLVWCLIIRFSFSLKIRFITDVLR